MFPGPRTDLCPKRHRMPAYRRIQAARGGPPDHRRPTGAPGAPSHHGGSRLHDRGALVSGTPAAPRSPLLHRYHAALAGHGVSGYGFENLWEDYRLSVIGRVAEAVWLRLMKLGAWIGAAPGAHLRAFEDLGCADLLA